MDIPASSGDGMGGSSGRPITRYGTTKYVPKEVSNHSYGDGPGHGTYRNRSRSTSPRHCFDRAGLNDRVDQIASSDHRTNMSPRSRNITYKFFASGNRHYGNNICWNSRSNPTSDSFNNYKLDDCTQSMDSGVYIAPAIEGSKGSRATLDLNVPVPYWDKYEGTSEQRVLRSSADDHAVCDNRYMAQSSSGVSVFEPRGTTVLGATIEGSMILTGNQLLKLNRSFRKPDVLDTVRSEASSSGQCLRSSEQISILIDILARILEEIKQLPELYAALSATSALKILQSYVSGSAGSDAPAASSTQLDLVNHSLKLINSVFSEQQAEVALSSLLPRAGDPGGVGPYGTDCENVELSVNSLQSGEKDQFAKWNNEEQNLPKAGELKEREDEGKLASNEVEGNTGENKETTDGKSLYAFKCALIEFVKELLSPTYIRDQINKDDFKITARKIVKKVISSVKSIDMPWTQENINIYLSVSGPKILELVQKYVKILKKKTGTAA